MKKTKKGFTLVELLVVIAILAILATVSVVGYTSFIQSANESVAMQELTQIREALRAEDINNKEIDLSDGITVADGVESAKVEDFIDTLGLEGKVTVTATTIEYKLNGAKATLTIATGEIVTAKAE